MKGVTFDQLVLDAFDQLSPYFVTEKSRVKKSEIKSEVALTYQAISAKLSTGTSTDLGEKQVRVLPPQLTPQNLARFIGATKCCWVLEDFHKIDESEKPRLAQLMKVFMDMSDEYADLKIVALGAVDTARQVVDYDKEMKNRVAEIRVDLMQVPELIEIIQKGEKALNVAFGPQVRNSIAAYSNGLAAVCHHLCLNICDAAGIERTQIGSTPVALTRDHFNEALKTYVAEASDSIKSAFDKALKKERKGKYNNAELILQAIARASDVGVARAELLQSIRSRESNFPNSNLLLYLKKLQHDDYGGLIRFSPLSNCFSYADPFYRVYAMVRLKDVGMRKQSEPSAHLVQALEALLKANVRFADIKSFNPG